MSHTQADGIVKADEASERKGGPAADELSEADLEGVSGGAVDFFLTLDTYPPPPPPPPHK